MCTDTKNDDRAETNTVVRRRSHSLLLTSVPLLILSVAPAALYGVTLSQDPWYWLAKMADAETTLNYDGRVIFRSGETLRSMRIIHRVDADGERSRLVSLDGVAREVIRDASRFTCISPGRQSVFVANRRSHSLLRKITITAQESLNKFYNLSVNGTDRVANRVTTRVVVDPRDVYRYGHRLWVDRDTGLLLKSELMNAQGRAIEEIVYTSVNFPSDIPDALLEPNISTKGFARLANEEGVRERGNKDDPGWEAAWLPDGFIPNDTSSTFVSNTNMPVEHLVFTDGLALFSVFVERLKSGSETFQGHSAVGAVNAFGSIVDGFQVTVIGEVPKPTVQSVAQGIVRR